MEIVPAPITFPEESHSTFQWLFRIGFDFFSFDQKSQEEISFFWSLNASASAVAAAMVCSASNYGLSIQTRFAFPNAFAQQSVWLQ